MKQLTVVKIGGNIVDDQLALEQFLIDFNRISAPKILIHGGGVMASQMAEKMGIETKMVKGRRITDLETLKLVTMIYAGWINKYIVANLQKIGCNAIGLSGADCDVVPATRRPPEPIDFGYVGDVDPSQIDNLVITNFLGRGICPVFCAITHDKNGSLLNTNADTMASSIAIAMSKDYCTNLIYCFEKEGVLYNPEDPDSIIPLITHQRFIELQEEGKIVGGMIPKLENAFAAIENGVSEVYIKHAKNLNNNKQTLLK
ncbi:MAG: acetylglutamate kinase [Bacteroidales bacterium]|jgi:acetylglutamate kinase|nr:acetylglutamate kinase [Bacteroidales bacterium]MDD3201893.1 acetylglutamate kinase [Bacteroidales bacterium]